MAEAQLNPNIEYINVGTGEDTGDGDPVREAFIKCNNNFGFLGANREDLEGILTGTVKGVSGRVLVDGINSWIPYYPDKPNNWPDGVPLDMNTAINRVAERLKQMLSTRLEQVLFYRIQAEFQTIIEFAEDFVGYEPETLWHNVQIYHNGIRLIMGEEHDFSVTGVNQIVIHKPEAIDIGDEMIAISQDFPVIQTHRANEVALKLL